MCLINDSSWGSVCLLFLKNRNFLIGIHNTISKLYPILDRHPIFFILYLDSFEIQMQIKKLKKKAKFELKFASDWRRKANKNFLLNIKYSLFEGKMFVNSTSS
jgi:hypothetical protein